MLRLFAALPLPESATDRLAALQRGLEGRPVDPTAMHVTLAFFGEIDEAVAEDLHSALGRVSAPAFPLWLDGAGCFGGDRPGLIYAAVRPDPALDHLQGKVAQAGRLAGLDIPARRYVPHVTLARYAPGKLTAAQAARLVAARTAFLAGPVEVTGFCLYRSDLGRAGPRYTALADYPLRGGSLRGGAS
jgi:2'-5' RNA ligase